MSGIIDEKGQQWEKCNECGKWVKIQYLHYEQPTPEHKYGRDLCKACAEELNEAAQEEANWYAELERGYAQDRM